MQLAIYGINGERLSNSSIIYVHLYTYSANNECCIECICYMYMHVQVYMLHIFSGGLMVWMEAEERSCYTCTCIYTELELTYLSDLVALPL